MSSAVQVEALYGLKGSYIWWSKHVPHMQVMRRACLERGPQKKLSSTLTSALSLLRYLFSRANCRSPRTVRYFSITATGGSAMLHD